MNRKRKSEKETEDTKREECNMAIGKKNVESIIKSYFESEEGKQFKKNAVSMQCPDDDQLKKFDSGGLEEVVYKNIGKHLVFCTKCIKRIILQRGLQVEEIEEANAKKPVSDKIVELLINLGEKGVERFVAGLEWLLPSGVALEPAHARVRGGVRKKPPKEKEEIRRLEPGTLLEIKLDKDVYVKRFKGFHVVALHEDPSEKIEEIGRWVIGTGNEGLEWTVPSTKGEHIIEICIMEHEPPKKEEGIKNFIEWFDKTGDDKNKNSIEFIVQEKLL